MNTGNVNERERALRHSAWKGLLWWDFRRHKQGFVIGLPSIVVVALMMGLVENASGPWFFIGALVMGVDVGIGFGRGEWVLGYEEYSLGLPPARRDRYYVRLFLGLAFLFVLLVAGLAAGPLGWVRALWELLPMELPAYDSAEELWAGFQSAGFHFLSAGLGFAAFVETYAVSMQVERGAQPNWMVKLVPFAVVAALAANLDLHYAHGNAGYLTGGVGLAWGLARVEWGCRRFERKDVVLDASGPAGGHEAARSQRVRASLLVILGLLALLAAGLFALLAGR